jgi:hypothetical protein
MKLSSCAPAAALLCALTMVGCGQQKTGSATAVQQGGDPAAQQPSTNEADTTSHPSRDDGDGVTTWTLADGSEFSAWAGGEGRASEPVWIWCDTRPGPVSYRIVSNGVAGEWKEMRQSDITDDNKLIDDPNGNFGAAETLPPGNYAIEFKVGAEEFSKVPVTLK